MQHVNVVIFCCESVGLLAGAVGGIIIHNEDVNLWQRLADAAGNQGKVFNLVIRWDDNQRRRIKSAHSN